MTDHDKLREIGWEVVFGFRHDHAARPHLEPGDLIVRKIQPLPPSVSLNPPAVATMSYPASRSFVSWSVTLPPFSAAASGTRPL